MTKVLLIGLDGATFDVVMPMLKDLPNLRRLMEKGSYGTLSSTPLPLTGQAWPSMFTGKNPGKHGIYDFLQAKKTNLSQSQHVRSCSFERKLMTSEDIDAEPLWDILAGYGLKSMIVNVPMTYPAKPINGCMITGVPHPPDTYPKELRSILPAGYKTLSGRRDFGEIVRMGEDVTKVSSELMEEAWDFFMVVISSTDFVGHWFWNEREKVKEVYKRADEMIGRLVKKAGSGTIVLVASDHGMGPLKKYVHINNWLVQKGYLVFKGGMRTSLKRGLFKAGFTLENARKAAFMLRTSGTGSSRLFRLIDRVFLSFSDIDWKKTRAYSSMNNSPIFLTDPSVKRELMGRLGELTYNGEKLVNSIQVKEDAYWGPHADEAPDIIFHCHNWEYSTKTYSEFASNRLLSDPEGGFQGDHRPEGIFIVPGKSRTKKASIYDIAPTVLSLFGLPVPEGMDGRPLVKGAKPR
jgi:predicted AlkP superfamily phosphohydrolase/phosphomutase